MREECIAACLKGNKFYVVSCFMDYNLSLPDIC